MPLPLRADVGIRPYVIALTRGVIVGASCARPRAVTDRPYKPKPTAPSASARAHLSVFRSGFALGVRRFNRILSTQINRPYEIEHI